MNNPTAELMHCKTNNLLHNSSSVCGPKIISARLTKLRLVGIAYSFLVSMLNFGRRCLGQGIKPKSCGMEYRKFSI